MYAKNGFFYSSDPVDIFTVKLLKGQVVTLVAFPAEPSSSASNQKTTLVVRDKQGALAPISTTSNTDAEAAKAFLQKQASGKTAQFGKEKLSSILYFLLDSLKAFAIKSLKVTIPKFAEFVDATMIPSLLVI